MRSIALPEWNDLPEAVRMEVCEEGRRWDAFIGDDIAHAVYLKLRELLDGLNLDVPDPQQGRIIWPEG